MKSLASISKERREEKWMQTETSLGVFSFFSECEKSVLGTPLERKWKCFFWLACFSKALKWWSLLWHLGTTDTQREKSQAADAMVPSACGRRPDPEFMEPRGVSLSISSFGWIRARDCRSKQPVLVTRGTEKKLRVHKLAVWYECKKCVSGE